MKTTWMILLATLTLVACKKESDDFDNNSSDYDHSRNVGASSNDLLSAAKYKGVEIELLYMPGFAPVAGVTDALNNFMTARMNKDNYLITLREIPASGSASLTLAQIRDIEKNRRQKFADGTTIRLSIIMTDGSYSEAGVLGIAYRNTSIALMGGTIHSNSGGFGQTSRLKLERTVIEHELSHLLGLVDLGSPLQSAHKDVAHGNHCTNNSCLMYYASETTDALGFLVTGNVPSLDAACLADLRANGGK